MTCIKTGAVIFMKSHCVYFSADLFRVGDAIVVRANGPLTEENSWRETHPLALSMPADYELHSSGRDEFWRRDLGVFVVLATQLKVAR